MGAIYSANAKGIPADAITNYEDSETINKQLTQKKVEKKVGGQTLNDRVRATYKGGVPREGTGDKKGGEELINEITFDYIDLSEKDKKK